MLSSKSYDSSRGGAENGGVLVEAVRCVGVRHIRAVVGERHRHDPPRRVRERMPHTRSPEGRLLRSAPRLKEVGAQGDAEIAQLVLQFTL